MTHELDHTTTVPGGSQVRMFEANGSAVGINDLDNDGDLDIVLANHAGMNTILWNDGGLSFRSERLTHGDSRAVTLIDLDADGWQDMVFSRTATAPSYWHNDGSGHFTQETLAGIGVPLYAINWADLDGDGDLDLVGATYDASLLVDYGSDFLMNGSGGVYYYENDDGYFRIQPLASSAQALALILVDLNGDGRRDIWVGNDFDQPDQVWYRTDGGWQSVQPFSATSHSTMSLDYGDIDNDGHLEFFASDMNPYDTDPDIISEWVPIFQSRRNLRPAGDVQIDANVLLSALDFANRAQAAGVDATGWSWSGKFGDLDQDGLLDLYVVNGFMEVSLLSYLPNHELVEENQARRNIGGGQFVPAPEWGLGSTRSGRGMSMADLDGDGDLDIVVNNLRGAAQLFENQLCQGSSLEVELTWLNSGNTHAVGARLALHTDSGVLYRRCAYCQRLHLRLQSLRASTSVFRLPLHYARWKFTGLTAGFLPSIRCPSTACCASAAPIKVQRRGWICAR
ncbi:MAG: VCBS repeat-containing protein [Anaerolineae bacterium]